MQGWARRAVALATLVTSIALVAGPAQAAQPADHDGPHAWASRNTAAVRALFRPGVHLDKVDDVRGPLDLWRVTFSQEGVLITMRITTRDAWKAEQLDAGHSICVKLYYGNRKNAAQSQVCVGGTDAAPSLQFATLDEREQVTATQVMDAGVQRLGPRTVEAKFAPYSASIPLGKFSWRAESRWTNDTLCTKACTDVFPDGGVVSTAAKLLVQPRCFGAAARAPGPRCVNPLLNRAVIPTPDEAVLQPNSFCLLVSEDNDLSVCRFRTTPADDLQQVALIGDSHAAHWRAGLNVVATALHWRGYSITRSGCPWSSATPILEGGGTEACLQYRRRTRVWFNLHPSVHTVFVASHDGDIVGNNSYQARVNGLKEALNWLPPTVKQIIVIRDAPRNNSRTIGCVDAALAKHKRTGNACALRRSFALPPDPQVTAVHQLRSKRIRVLDMTRYFCSRKYCFPVVGGALTHKDNAHITDVFSTTLGPHLLTRVKNLLAVMPK